MNQKSWAPCFESIQVVLKDIPAAGMEKVFSPPAKPGASATMVYSAQELHSRLEPQREAGREASRNLRSG